MTPRGLKDPDEVAKATEAAQKPVPEGHPEAEDDTTASEPVTGPLDFGELMDREHKAWLALPFVRASDKTKTDDWAVAEVKPQGGDNGIFAEFALGTYYAVEFIDHVRGHPGVDVRGSLGDVVRAICEQDKWDSIEIAFFHALCEFIASGSVSVTDESEVRFAPPPAGDGDSDLFKLCEKWRQALTYANSLEQQEAADEANDRCRGIEREILATKAQTPEGVIAKLRLVAELWSEEPEYPEIYGTTDQRLMCSAVNDAGALPRRNGGEAQQPSRTPDAMLPEVGPDHSDAEMLALGRQWQRARADARDSEAATRAAMEADPEASQAYRSGVLLPRVLPILEGNDAAWERAGDLEAQITAMPAASPAGIAVKLTIALSYMRGWQKRQDEDWRVQVAWSALDDAERLAKGGAS